MLHVPKGEMMKKRHLRDLEESVRTGDGAIDHVERSLKPKNRGFSLFTLAITAALVIVVLLAVFGVITPSH